MVNSGNNPGSSRLYGAHFIRFALDVIDLLRNSEPHGLDRDGFLSVYFNGSPPTNPQVQDHWWEEFKRASDYSCDHFNRGEDGWAWIRALPGHQRGQYFYHVVAVQHGGRVQPTADVASLARLEPFTTRRWLTQTRSRQRVRAAEGLAIIQEGLRTGNHQMQIQGQRILEEFIMLSPALAAINFDTGLVTADLEQLSRSTNPHIARVLRAPIRNALQSARRLERDVNNLVGQVLRLAQIYQQGSQRSLP